MHVRIAPTSSDLVGLGLYTTAEASALLHLSAPIIRRWMRGYSAGGKRYEPMWQPQIESMGEEIYLGFNDLQELRVAAAFVTQGLGAHQVREAIALARDLIGEDRPLSTTRFRSDGRSILLQVVESNSETRLIDLFRKQYTFVDILEKSLKNLEYADGRPARWWPRGRATGIVLDPARAFGQPIEEETSVPVSSLVMAVEAEGSEQAAASVWSVPVRAVRRALAFERDLQAAA